MENRGSLGWDYGKEACPDVHEIGIVYYGFWMLSNGNTAFIGFSCIFSGCGFFQKGFRLLHYRNRQLFSSGKLPVIYYEWMTKNTGQSVDTVRIYGNQSAAMMPRKFFSTCFRGSII